MTEASERVHKILADALRLAEDPNATEGEREQATRTAQILMEKYALTEAMANAANRVLSGCVNEIMEFSGVFGVQHRDIAAVIVMANDGRPVVSTDKRMVPKKNGGYRYDHVQILHANLHSNDLDRVKTLIASVSLQSQNAMSQFDNTQPHVKGHQKYLDRRTFLQAYMLGLKTRLFAAKEAARREAAAERAQETGGTFAESQNAFALAIREKDDEMEKFMREQYGSDGLRNSRRRSNKMGSDDAFGAGHSAGRNASTGEASVAPARRALG